MLAILVGLIFIAGGIWGIVQWPQDVLAVLKGSLPVMIIAGGLIAVVAGFAGMKDSASKTNGNSKNQEKVK